MTYIQIKYEIENDVIDNLIQSIYFKTMFLILFEGMTILSSIVNMITINIMCFHGNNQRDLRV